MCTRIVAAILAVAPLLSASLEAQSVPAVGQGPPTRRDSRWRIQQERSDYVRAAESELAYLLRHQSIADVVPFITRHAHRGTVLLEGERPYGDGKYERLWRGGRGYGDDGAGFWWNQWYPWAWPYPFVPLWRPELLDLRPEWLVPVRTVKRGLQRLSSLEEPGERGGGLSGYVEELQVITPGRDYPVVPPRTEESEYRERLRQRPRPGVSIESKDVPDYCFSGAGHPLGGREWCYRHGYAVGGGWVREAGNGIVMERPRSPITRAELAASIGPDLTIELDVQRARFGLSAPLAGSYVATLENGAVLKVRSNRIYIAEIVDLNRDGRVEAIWRRVDR